MVSSMAGSLHIKQLCTSFCFLVFLGIEFPESFLPRFVLASSEACTIVVVIGSPINGTGLGTFSYGVKILLYTIVILYSGKNSKNLFSKISKIANHFRKYFFEFL